MSTWPRISGNVQLLLLLPFHRYGYSNLLSLLDTRGPNRWIVRSKFQLLNMPKIRECTIKPIAKLLFQWRSWSFVKIKIRLLFFSLLSHFWLISFFTWLIDHTMKYSYRSGYCRSLTNVIYGSLAWASCQIRKIEVCACAGNAGNVFPATAGKRSRHASRHVRHARAVMHVGIAN